MRVFVAGHKGMVGRHVSDIISSCPEHELITAERKELDLLFEKGVSSFLAANSPDQIIICAAKVGGILANSLNQYEFLIDNLRIQNNILHAAKELDIKKIIFLGSSCIYPKFCPQPMKEEDLLSSSLEETNEAYAIAKITGIKLCQALNKQYGFDARALMPTNLYGAYDNFDLKNSHVIPALIRKFLDAKEKGLDKVEIWGTGSPLREFMHVEDLASAIKFIMDLSKDEFQEASNNGVLMNVGSNSEVSIKQLANLISDIVNFDGSIFFNTSYPDGTPRKLMNSGRLQKLGWYPKISLKDGLKKTIDWYVDNANS
ncbi:MAG: GDP-L-fucose synthase [SAR86 cluster bacterium]|nr:GDP-L-fucose synthase [SAR86 cluster bacterium]